ncbi:MAG TPA: FAD-dependent oxidoreductase [Bryobacteraceae bacterium]|nr:FAD-dependent oxidoreductase [Bryobacteraceae bacterium]
MRIGIIGGGIAGLTCAYRLAQAGHQPVVMEGASTVGGLGATFLHEGVRIEKFYHIILDADSDLLSLVAELGGAERMLWRDTGMGIFTDGALFSMNGALDLLRFRPLTVLERLRTAAGGVFMTTVKRNGNGLDNITATSYLRRLFGARVYTRIWEPLLRAKFGDAAEEIPAYWIWSRLNREKSRGPEIKGYLRGGYGWLADALVTQITARGGEVRVSTKITGFEETPAGIRIQAQDRTDDFDCAISTLPLSLLVNLAPQRLADALPSPAIRYQGVVNVVVISCQQFQPHYWTAVLDPSFAFQGIVETTHVIPTQWTGNRHLAYLMNYCRADSETYSTPDDVLIRQALDGLGKLFPQFNEADTETCYVFRTPHVEPVWTLGYLQRRPAVRLANSRLYLCTTAQAYPRVNSWNTSISLAQATVDAMLSDIRAR